MRICDVLVDEGAPDAFVPGEGFEEEVGRFVRFDFSALDGREVRDGEIGGRGGKGGSDGYDKDEDE